jgi:hypothetical protein
VWLAQRGLQVDVFDIAEVGVTKAQGPALQACVSVRYAGPDVGNLIWPEAVYEGVAAIFVQFAHPTPRAQMFVGMRRRLKLGNVLLLQRYTQRQLGYRTGGQPFVENLALVPRPGLHVIC